MTSRLKKTILVTAKLAVAAGLLTWVLARVDWDKLLASLRGADWLLLAAALAAQFVSMTVCSMRLKLLLGVQDIAIRAWEIVRLTFLGQFFNTVVPGTVGGDLVKAYYITRHTPKKAAVLVSVFMDRVLGLTQLAALAGAMAVVALAAGFQTFDDMRVALIVLLCLLGALAMALTFLLSRRFRRLFHLDKIYGRLSIAHHFSAAGDAAAHYRKHPGLLAAAVGATFISQALWIGSVWTIGQALSIDLPWHHYVLYVPLIYTIGAIPISPGGVGVVEYAFCQFLVVGAVQAEPVLALALLARAAQILCGLPGIAVTITGAKVPKIATMEAELGVDSDPAA